MPLPFLFLYLYIYRVHFLLPRRHQDSRPPKNRYGTGQRNTKPVSALISEICGKQMPLPFFFLYLYIYRVHFLLPRRHQDSRPPKVRYGTGRRLPTFGTGQDKGTLSRFLRKSAKSAGNRCDNLRETVATICRKQARQAIGNIPPK